MSKITSKELVPLKRSIASVAEQVTALTIKSADDMKKAVVVLSTLNKYADSVKAKKDTLAKPLNLAIKNVRAMFKPLEETYEGAIEALRAKMSAYQTEAKRLADEEAAKIAARVKPGTGNLTIETAVEKIQAIDKPADNVATDVGDVKFRETKILKVVDASIVPREYLVLDEKKILDDLKAGKMIAGCEIEIIQTPVNYR